MPVTLPDATVFDADSDRISTSRPEIKKIADIAYTLGNEWNSQGDSFGVGGIENVVDDVSPQLGGDLDVNSQKLVSTSNGNIVLDPNGSGKVVCDSATVLVGNNNASVTLSSQGTGQLTICTNEDTTNVARLTLETGTAGDINVIAGNTGKVVLSGSSIQVPLSCPIHAGGSEVQLGLGSADIFINGTLKLKTPTGTPSNTSTVVDWINVEFGGAAYYIPVYQ